MRDRLDTVIQISKNIIIIKVDIEIRSDAIGHNVTENDKSTNYLTLIRQFVDRFNGSVASRISLL